MIADCDCRKAEHGCVRDVGGGDDLVGKILLEHADQRLKSERKLPFKVLNLIIGIKKFLNVPWHVGVQVILNVDVAWHRC